MKKPFVLLMGKRNIAKLFVGVILVLLACGLFIGEKEAVAVFSQNQEGVPNSLYGMVGTLV